MDVTRLLGAVNVVRGEILEKSQDRKSLGVFTCFFEAVIT